jgi:hypothetical protein
MSMSTSVPRLRLILVLGLALAPLAGAGCAGDLTGGVPGGEGGSGGDGGDGGGSAGGSRDAGRPASGGVDGGGNGGGGGSGADGGGVEADGGGAGAADCGGAAVCDDFEGAAPGGPPDPAVWSIATPDCSGAGSLAVDGAEAHTGARSVRIDGAGSYCDHIFIASDAALAIDGAVHGRFWLRLAQPLGDSHVTFFAMHDAATNSDVRMGGQSRILMWNRQRDDATLPELSPTGISLSVAFTAGVWTCVQFAVDGAAGTIETSVDGQPVAGLVVDGSPTPDIDAQWHRDPNWHPDLVDIRLGWESYAGQSMTLWVDDVAFGPAPIACD